MLTPDQIEALRLQSEDIIDPVVQFLIGDIAQRISEAGHLTSTAAYQVWRLQHLGVSQRELKKHLRKLLKVSHRELRKLLTQTAEVGYNYDIQRFPYVQAVPFERNEDMQRIVEAAVKLAEEDLGSLTQTLGFVAPNGKAMPLTDAYREVCDFAFKKVFTGAQDYNSAVREATKGLVDKGILRLDYDSGVHRSVEAAVRGSVMGGLGLLQEQISQQNHDDFGCDGWEISAHANSAPDHEPIQGKQYSDEEYERLNNSLKRQIGTLNCGHSASPIIMGIHEPQYTPEELEKFREDNEKGITYNGKHYTMYEATQRQRLLERKIRKLKRRILVDEKLGDTEQLSIDRTKYVVMNDEYKRFSKAAGLRIRHERMEMTGFGPKQHGAAESMTSGNGKYTNRIRMARASDTFTVYPPEKGDAIKPQSIYKELQKSDVGKHAYEFIIGNRINVEISYTDNVKPTTRGISFGSNILVYARNTQSVRLTTETIIHEATHIELNLAKPTQWEEAYCIAQEAKHRKKKLTYSDLKAIIKETKELYPELPWR